MPGYQLDRGGRCRIRTRGAATDLQSASHWPLGNLPPSRVQRPVDRAHTAISRRRDEPNGGLIVRHRQQGRPAGRQRTQPGRQLGHALSTSAAPTPRSRGRATPSSPRPPSERVSRPPSTFSRRADPPRHLAEGLRPENFRCRLRVRRTKLPAPSNRALLAARMELIRDAGPKNARKPRSRATRSGHQQEARRPASRHRHAEEGRWILGSELPLVAAIWRGWLDNLAVPWSLIQDFKRGSR